MKMSSFIAGVFGTLGFVLSMVAGIFADNPLETILLKAILCAVICYIIGYIVGLMAQQVSLEHAQGLAKRVAEQDAAIELKAAQARADSEEEAAANAGGETISAAPLVPGK